MARGLSPLLLWTGECTISPSPLLCLWSGGKLLQVTLVTNFLQRGTLQSLKFRRTDEEVDFGRVDSLMYWGVTKLMARRMYLVPCQGELEELESFPFESNSRIPGRSTVGLRLRVGLGLRERVQVRCHTVWIIDHVVSLVQMIEAFEKDQILLGRHRDRLLRDEYLTAHCNVSVALYVDSRVHVAQHFLGHEPPFERQRTAGQTSIDRQPRDCVANIRFPCPSGCKSPDPNSTCAIMSLKTKRVKS